eukprot:TRINITY_DN1709_c1_g1_i3.p1 TRINITY_DN1709_c1_g1~~TRINITY_DN1709_c1_g1_i3.p1  ORF type:complete len:451 (+),score=124.64 TRINITY_DN1709_c1_g1_i3:35-1354(+)
MGREAVDYHHHHDDAPTAAASASSSSVPFYALELMIGLIVSFVFDPRQLPNWAKSVIVAGTSFFLPYLCYRDPHHCADVWPISTVFDHLQISEPRTMSLLIGFLFTAGVVGYLLVCYFLSLFVSVRYRRDRKSHRYMISAACIGVLFFLLFVAFVSEHSPFGLDDEAPRAFVKSTVTKKGLRIKGEDRASYLRQWYRLQREVYLDALVSDPLLYCGAWILLCGVVLLCLFALYEFKAAANEEGVGSKKKKRSSRRRRDTTTDEESSSEESSASEESSGSEDEHSEEVSDSSSGASESEDEDQDNAAAKQQQAADPEPVKKGRKRSLRKGGKGGTSSSTATTDASGSLATGAVPGNSDSVTEKTPSRRPKVVTADGFTVIQRRKPRDPKAAPTGASKSSSSSTTTTTTVAKATKPKRVVRLGKDGKKVPKAKAIEGVWGI